MPHGDHCLGYQTRSLGVSQSILLSWHCIPLAFNDQSVDKAGDQYVLPETLLLKQL